MEKNPVLADNSPQTNSVVIACDICGLLFTKEYMRSHKRHNHSKNKQRLAQKASQVSKKTAAAQQATPKTGLTNYSFQKPGGIILISRRGLRVEAGRCAECGIRDKVMWRYAQSNRGTVCICSNCKAKVFERSFGKSPMDLLDRAYRG